MPDLNFEVVGAEVAPLAATPMLAFKLRITSTNEQERIQSIMLHCQIRLVVTRRRYSVEEQVRLLDVFGEAKRWGDTLRDLLWVHTNSIVPTFSGSTVVDLHIPCSYDFEIVSTKYFYALAEGVIPLTFLFSGSIFYTNAEGSLQVEQISWSKEASFRLPVSLWQDMLAHYYPNSTWLRLNKDVFDQLYRYKAMHGLPTWEDVCTHLLQASEERAPL
jgi:Family of unknown function (DUF6084)